MRKYRYKPGIYTEDSTKGASLLGNPKTYKRDVLVQVWMQSRHLATLLNWLESIDRKVRFRSEIVQFTVEEIVKHIRDSKVCEVVEYASEARDILKDRFGVESNPKHRGEKNALHNMMLDDRRRESDVDLVATGMKIMESMKKEGEKERVPKKDDSEVIEPVETGTTKTTIPSIARQRSKEEIEADRIAKDEAEKEKLKGLDSLPTNSV